MTEPLSENTADVIVVGAGAGRLDDRVLPGQGRTRRAAAGEDRVPAREGLRRRPDPARHQAAGRDGHRHLRGGRLAAQQGPADHRRRRPPPAGLAGSRLLPGLRPGPQARRLRRAARPPGAEGRRPAVRALQRRRARSSTSAPAGSPACSAKLARRRRPVTFHAPLVVAADGNSTRLSLAMGLHRREDRPMGVAVRTYFTSPRHEDDYLESWLELWDRRGPARTGCCPATAGSSAWATAPPTSASASLNTSDSFKELDWREVLKAWCASMPEDWGYTPENMTGPIRGAALPDGLQPPAALHQGPAAGR